MITFVTTPGLLDPPGRGLFSAPLLSLVTTATGLAACIGEVMVAPPRRDVSTVIAFTLFVPSPPPASDPAKVIRELAC